MEILTGHVAAERRGDDLYLRCAECGAEELVINYEHGKTPQKFTWLPVDFNGREYAKCHKCGKEHDQVVPGAR